VCSTINGRPNRSVIYGDCLGLFWMDMRWDVVADTEIELERERSLCWVFRLVEELNTLISNRMFGPGNISISTPFYPLVVVPSRD
jgi:hypothetical protein